MGNLDQLNETILLGLAQWRTPGINKAFVDITALGSTLVISMFATVVFAILWTVPNDRIGAAKMLMATVGAELWVEIIKRIVQEPRPTIVPALVTFTGFSFPSGHSLTAAAAYGSFAIAASGYVRERAGRAVIWVTYAVIVALVGLSRVYLGVHYPTDVVGGGLLGITWLALTEAFWRHRAKGATKRIGFSPIDR